MNTDNSTFASYKNCDIEVRLSSPEPGRWAPVVFVSKESAGLALPPITKVGHCFESGEEAKSIGFKMAHAVIDQGHCFG
ncbi:hypothetical protein [Chitinolyticbacter meiyuanensis]|uniref:hypothetical protein n=1 Tax=Chitinolyticbacter meiyuanensis TaxID=682798 RepID=UPI0011E5FF1F|nr:hypothetical protein [Chitinolyticbacter meiyuanensis]